MSNGAGFLAYQLDQETSERLERLAQFRELASDKLMYEAVSQYLDREERLAQFDRDTEEASNEYHATGLHVTAEEADAWLAKLEAGEDPEPPACHR